MASIYTLFAEEGNIFRVPHEIFVIGTKVRSLLLNGVPVTNYTVERGGRFIIVEDYKEGDCVQAHFQTKLRR